MNNLVKSKVKLFFAALSAQQMPDIISMWQCIFYLWFKTFPVHQNTTKTTFGKLSRRPIDLEKIEKVSVAELLYTRPMLEGYRGVTIL